MGHCRAAALGLDSILGSSLIPPLPIPANETVQGDSPPSKMEIITKIVFFLKTIRQLDQMSCPRFFKHNVDVNSRVNKSLGE